MQIMVAYSAQARVAAGTAGETVTVPGPALENLLQELVRRHGDPLRRLLLDAQGRLQPTVLLALDDQVIDSPAGVTLRDGQTLAILPPIAGG